MSTQAIVSIKNEDGTYRSILIKKDGYVENPGVGYVLESYIGKIEYVNNLIDGGNREYLDPRDYMHSNKPPLIDKPNMDNLRCFSSFNELLDYCIEQTIDYVYIFDDDTWFWSKLVYEDSDDDDGDESTKVKRLTYGLKALLWSDTINYVDVKKVDRPTYCSYRSAIQWNGMNIVLLNNVPQIDPEFDPYSTKYEYNEDDDEEESIPEFYQYYITDASNDTVEWYASVFPDLTFAYSDVLDSWILCVDHWGTSWDYVPTQYVGALYVTQEDCDRFNKN